MMIWRSTGQFKSPVVWACSGEMRVMCVLFFGNIFTLSLWMHWCCVTVCTEDSRILGWFNPSNIDEMSSLYSETCSWSLLGIIRLYDKSGNWRCDIDVAVATDSIIHADSMQRRHCSHRLVHRSFSCQVNWDFRQVLAVALFVVIE